MSICPALQGTARARVLYTDLGLSSGPSSPDTHPTQPWGYLGLARPHRSGIHYTWRLPTLGVPSQCVIVLQGGTDTQLPCNFLAMLGGALQAQDQILDFLTIIMQHSHGSGKACKSSQGRQS